jgi:hypothetical protein
MSWVSTALADLHTRFGDIGPVIFCGCGRVGKTIPDTGIDIRILSEFDSEV